MALPRGVLGMPMPDRSIAGGVNAAVGTVRLVTAERSSVRANGFSTA